MKKYSLILSQHRTTDDKIVMHELCKNGKSLFNSFIEEVDNNQFADLASAIKILNKKAQLFTLRTKQYRKLDNEYKLSEVKKNGIRIYFHTNEDGMIIILGGYKKDQPKDIEKAKGLIKGYYDEIQQEAKKKNS